MPTTCALLFENNPQNVFYSGQLMIGNIHLNLTREKKIRGIFLKIKGKSQTRWSEGSGDDGKNYGTTEEYLNTKTYLVGDYNASMKLKRGEYNLSFRTQLPVELPTSFQGKYGYVRYHAAVVVDIPMRPDNEFETPFTVIKALDLNFYPALRQPITVKKTETFFFTGPMIVSVRAPVGGYTPGQTINFEITVDNKSNKMIPKFKVKLINNIAYHTKRNSSKKKEKDVVLVEEITGKCDPRKSGTYHVNIQVPPVPPTEEGSIIKLRYFCSISCIHTSKINLPIVIGSIPILDMHPSTMPSNSNTHSSPSASSIPNTSSAISNSSKRFPHDEPPTYEEAMRDENAINGDFFPKYPCFKRQTSYSNNNK